MKLMTREIEAALLNAASHVERPPTQTPVLVEFFTPDANATWHVLEAERRDNSRCCSAGAIWATAIWPNSAA